MDRMVCMNAWQWQPQKFNRAQDLSCFTVKFTFDQWKLHDYKIDIQTICDVTNYAWGAQILQINMWQVERRLISLTINWRTVVQCQTAHTPCSLVVITKLQFPCRLLMQRLFTLIHLLILSFSILLLDLWRTEGLNQVQWTAFVCMVQGNYEAASCKSIICSSPCG